MKRSDISPERVLLLNSGQTEVRNLMEGLVMDFNSLLSNVFPKTKLPSINNSDGIVKRMQTAAKVIHDQFGIKSLELLANHPSDTVRGWLCYVIALQGLGFKESMKLIKPFADDRHFGVREWAWMALRPQLMKDLKQSLTALKPWTLDASERIRRFAIEICRPKGVWCSHIIELRQEPTQAIQLLEAVKADPALYVQKSVGNWLNDAAKDNPAWVKELCATWQEDSAAKATNYICKRALRSFKAVKRIIN
jgi:3-methyladenine DNA glycosylase AlkC